jgi:streptogramin lyase
MYASKNTLSLAAILMAIGCHGSKPPLPHKARKSPAPAAKAPANPADSPCRRQQKIADAMPAVHGILERDGALWIADSYARIDGRSRLYKIAGGEGSPEPSAIAGKTLAGIGSSSDGRLLVCDVAASKVMLYSKDDRLVAEWQVTQPWNAAALDEQRVVVVSNKGFATRLGPEDGVEQILGDLDAPFGVAVAADDSLWITEQGAKGEGRVGHWSPSGTLLEEAPGPWDNPEGIAIDETGALWIADTGANKVWRVVDGQRSLAAELPLPIAVATAGDSVLVSSGGKPAGLWRLRDCPSEPTDASGASAANRR